MISPRRSPLGAALCLGVILVGAVVSAHGEPELSDERLVIQTEYGDIELAFYPTVAPVTVEHILKLARLGAYNTNHIFRVDRGFVAQVADVLGGRATPLSPEQREEAQVKVPGEFSDIKHTRGVLSMARFADPNSGTSSFSILLGNAPHLDHQYAVFGRMTSGDEVLTKLEELPTRKEGIFVMPQKRIGIHSTYMTGGDEGYGAGGGGSECPQKLDALQRRFEASEVENARLRRGCLP